MQASSNEVAQYRDGQSSIASDLKDVRTECEGIKTGFAEQIDAMRIDILQVIGGCQDLVHEGVSRREYSLGAISRKIDEMQSAVADVPIHHRILCHLVFDSMSARHSGIHVAKSDTCGWILDDDFSNENSYDFSDSDPYSSDSSMENQEICDNDLKTRKQSRFEKEKSYRRQTCQQVLDWLRAGDSILHISGNAGSGKSTLMKFLHGHRRTKDELLIWAGSKRLAIGHFFFWSAGSTPQRTLAGLYQSLLFQALSQCPELIAHVFPSQLDRMKKRRGSKQVEAVEDFSDDHIREAFDLLITRTSYDTHRFCFLIDGLDECDGNRLHHEQLAAMLKSWTVGGDVKLCVSSRPWPEFSKTFQSFKSLTLHLHLLNRFDIETYCIGKLMKDEESGQDPGLCRSLAKTIVSNASGIFLWAHLVTDVVLQGIRQGDPANILMDKVKEMPHQLKDLYKKLREPIVRSRLDKARSDRMLILAAKYIPRGVPDMNAMAFSWLDRTDEQLGLDDFAFPPASECQPYSEDEIAARLKKVAQQVNGLTRGFLEVVEAGHNHPVELLNLTKSFWSTRIQFCHRSARDYLLEEMHDTLKADFPNFDSVYQRIYIAELIYGKDRDKPFEELRFWEYTRPQGSTDAGPECLEKLEFEVRPENRPRWNVENHTKLISDTRPVSFLHYVACYGLHNLSRVMLERDRNTCSSASTALSRRGKKTSFLVAFANFYQGFRVDICSSELLFRLELLRRRVEVDVLVDVISDGVPTKVPVWLIEFINIATAVLPTIPPEHCDLKIQQDRLKYLGELHAYSLNVGQPLTLKVGALIPTEDHRHIFDEREDLSYTGFNIDSQGFIRLVTASEDSMLVLSSWLEHLRTEGITFVSKDRWVQYHTDPAPGWHREMEHPFALLAIDWGENHSVLKYPQLTRDDRLDQGFLKAWEWSYQLY